VDSAAAGDGREASRRVLAAGIARTLLTVVVVVVLYFLLPLDRPFSARTVLVLATGLACVGLLAAWQTRAILRSRVPALRAIEAVALSLPLFLLLFAAVDVLLSTSDPQAFTEPLSHIDGLYFVVTVFATVGFGDIAPVSDVARVLTTVQMIGDLLVIGLVLRVFLSAVNRGRQRAAGQRALTPREDDPSRG
jgi:hypothetical protein